MSSSRIRFVLSAAIAVASAVPAVAQDAGGPNASGIPEQSIATSLPYNGDPGGHRKALAERGINYGLNYVGEWQGNTSGGTQRGSIYIGRLEAFADIDLAKFGWQGLTLHSNAYQIHGRGLSRENLGNNLMTASFIEALPATRLSELWLEQKMMGDKVAFRFGQLAADTEFNTSSYAGQFHQRGRSAGRRSWERIFQAVDRPIRWQRPASA